MALYSGTYLVSEQVKEQTNVQGDGTLTRFEQGYFNRQLSLLLVLLGLVVFFAIPKFAELSDRKKVGEAYHLANHSQIRVAEFYSLSARFPQTELELQSVTGDLVHVPSFVEAVEVDSADEEHDVIVRIYLDGKQVGNPDGVQPELYLAGNRSSAHGTELQWRCGARGLDASVLPAACSG